jgi:hypothetical protein
MFCRASSPRTFNSNKITANNAGYCLDIVAPNTANDALIGVGTCNDQAIPV